MLISLIVIADLENGIGINNQLLCHLPADLKYFKQTTSGHCIVMGRKTFESIGKPLPNRTNIVISRDQNLSIEGCLVKPTIEAAIDYARNINETELFITGGGTLYELTLPLANKVYLTRIHHRFHADTFFPELPKEDWELIHEAPHFADEKNAYNYTFQTFHRKLVM